MQQAFAYPFMYWVGMNTPPDADPAAVAEFSVSHFKALFKNAAGLPAHRFVMQRRVERACVHIAEGRLDMTEIALATGFAHPSHMARCIRATRGVHAASLRRA